MVQSLGVEIRLQGRKKERGRREEQGGERKKRNQEERERGKRREEGEKNKEERGRRETRRRETERKKKRERRGNQEERGRGRRRGEEGERKKEKARLLQQVTSKENFSEVFIRLFFAGHERFHLVLSKYRYREMFSLWTVRKNSKLHQVNTINRSTSSLSYYSD